MKIECFVTSVNFGDYLYYSLPSFKDMFDNVVVITSPDDLNTQNVCKMNGVDVFLGDPHKDGAIFRKGHMIDEALKSKLKYNEWVLILDADIYIPPQTRERIEEEKLDPECLYGGTRIQAAAFSDFQKYLIDPTYCLDWHRRDGVFKRRWQVIGYFQLFNYNYLPKFGDNGPEPNGPYYYPTTSSDAGYDDLLFSDSWGKIGFLPLYLIHLSPFQQYWEGRGSPVFDKWVIKGGRKNIGEKLNNSMLTKEGVLLGDDDSFMENWTGSYFYINKDGEVSPSDFDDRSLDFVCCVDYNKESVADLVESWHSKLSRGGVIFGDCFSSSDNMEEINQLIPYRVSSFEWGNFKYWYCMNSSTKIGKLEEAKGGDRDYMYYMLFDEIDEYLIQHMSDQVNDPKKTVKSIKKHEDKMRKKRQNMK